MRLRNGYISGLPDEILESLLDEDQALLLSEYETEVSNGASDTESTINIPIVFVYVRDNSEQGEQQGIKIDTGDALDASAYLLEHFNSAAADLNISFTPAYKTGENDILDYPGTLMVDAEDLYSQKIYVTPENTEETVNMYYRNTGVAMADQNYDGTHSIAGVGKTALIAKILNTHHINFSKVYTVIIVNRLNTLSLGGEQNKNNFSTLGWSYINNIHPAVSNNKPFVSMFSLQALSNYQDTNLEDHLNIDLQTIINAHNNYFVGNFNIIEQSPFTEDDLKITKIELIIKHSLASSFGLLPTGTGMAQDLLLASGTTNCDANGCLLLGGQGNCIDDVPPNVMGGFYFKKFIEDDYGAAGASFCNNEAPGLFNSLYISMYNIMNFYRTETATYISFSENQIDKIRAGFETEGTVLKSLKDNFNSYSFNLETLCDNTRQISVRAINKAKNYTQSFKAVREEESYKFNYVKNKVSLLCNTLINR